MSVFGSLGADHTLVASDVGAGGALAVYGDGSDGDVTIASGTTTLTRDTFYNSLTIANGATLKPNGYRIYCRGTLTNNGTITIAGGSASGSSGGSSFGGGALGFGGGSDSATTGAGRVNPTVVANALGGAGGSGGSGGSGAGGGTTTATPPVANQGSGRDLVAALTGQLRTVQPNGGMGGSTGSGDGSNKGGGSGAGGALIVIAARTITNGSTGVITAAGGAGGSPGAPGNIGGGGGGGGGVIWLVYNSLSNTGSITVAGGAFGTGNGTGANGAAGGTGLLVQIQN